jgi:hypothetical protein
MKGERIKNEESVKNDALDLKATGMHPFFNLTTLPSFFPP